MVVAIISTIGLIFAYECFLPESTKPKEGPCGLNGVMDCFAFIDGENKPSSYFQCETGQEVNTTFNDNIVCYRWMWKDLTTLRLIEQIGICAAVLQAIQGFLKIYFSANFFAFERRKGIISGMFHVAKLIATPNPFLLRHRDQWALLKRPTWLCLFLLTGALLAVLPVIILVIEGYELISLSLLSYTLMLFLWVTWWFAILLGVITDLNDSFTFSQPHDHESAMDVLRIRNRTVQEQQDDSSRTCTAILRCRRPNRVHPHREENDMDLTERQQY
ncbi:unnamed protein product [Adineta steineri]|uniref:Uncharacterized protein n=1 Tax=Adineta steineri TaxID=433720 RepID=A0A813XVL3_9BILA|nr:unnamed protein product [Adineta steineri]CAF3865255.1 unnamed protein product [Adineta steineri]